MLVEHNLFLADPGFFFNIDFLTKKGIEFPAKMKLFKIDGFSIQIPNPLMDR